MHWRLLRLGSHIAAGGDDDEGVGLAVRVLEVKPAEEDGGGGDYTLLERKFLPQFPDY